MPDIAGERAKRVIQIVLNRREGDRNFEVKRVSGKMVGKAIETVCAFANTEGGYLALGVDDPTKAAGNSRIFGIEENPEAVDELCRKLATQFVPPLDPPPRTQTIEAFSLPGHAKTVMLVRVDKSRVVHSVVNNGTWTRGETSNRELTAPEIVTLTYNRGTASVVNEVVDVDFNLLATPLLTSYLHNRGLDVGRALAERLLSLGLAIKIDDGVAPLRAAVLLFCEHPGSVMRQKAAVRVFHYSGTRPNEGEDPNLIDRPKTFDGPLAEQIDAAHEFVLGRLAMGLTMASSGFRTHHRYPERVVKEAITNAVIHRDYRLAADVHVRIFDDRIEVESPGTLPGEITPATIFDAGSLARNQLIVDHLREFPSPPNLDANEGVRMMRTVMRLQNLLEPLYQELQLAAGPSVLLTLFNEERPPLWDQVSHWIKQNGSADNSAVRQIAGVDTLKASKLLAELVRKGLLVQDRSRGSRNMRYLFPLHADTKSIATLFEDNHDD